MVVYAAGSAGLALLVKPIFDNVLVPNAEDVGVIAALILLAYFVKGLGGYVSGFLMADVGQRVVRDLREPVVPAHPGPVGGVLRPAHVRPARVAHHERRQPGPERRVGDDRRISSRESLAVVGFAGAMFYLDWNLALVCMTAAPLVVYPLVRLGQRVRRMSRRGQEELEQVTHIATEGADRPSHRQGVRRRGARGGAVRPRHAGAVSHEHEDHERPVGAAADDGVHRRRGGGRRPLVRIADAST